MDHNNNNNNNMLSEEKYQDYGALKASSMSEDRINKTEISSPTAGPSHNASVIDKFDFDEEYDKTLGRAGGCGIFQIFLFVSMLLNFSAVNFYSYNISFYELMPKQYLCVFSNSTQPIVCQPDQFCNNPDLVSYEVDYNSDGTLRNWATKMDFACESHFKIGLVGSSTFFGWVITLLFIPRLSDVYGRKWFFRGGMIVQAVAYTFIVLTKSINVLIACQFAIGLGSTARCQVGFIYFMEFIPKRLQSAIGSSFFILESIIGLSGAIYFFWATSAYPYLYIGYSFQVIGAITSFGIPESPKFLLSVKQYDLARVSLTKIYKLNRKAVDVDGISLRETYERQESQGDKEVPPLMFFLK